MLCRFANLKSSLKHVYLFLKYTYFLLYNRGEHIAFHSCECNIPDMAHLWHKAKMPVTVVWHLCFTSQLKRYMFRTIWEFAQSWDCAAHSQNLEIAFQSSQSRDCVITTCVQSQDCLICMRNLDIYKRSTLNFVCTPDHEQSTVRLAGWKTTLISGVCLHRWHTEIWKSE